MIDKIKEHIAEVEAFVANSHDEIETFRIKYLGKKGLLNDFLLNLEMFLTSKKRNSDKLSIN